MVSSDAAFSMHLWSVFMHMRWEDMNPCIAHSIHRWNDTRPYAHARARLKVPGRHAFLTALLCAASWPAGQHQCPPQRHVHRWRVQVHNKPRGQALAGRRTGIFWLPEQGSQAAGARTPGEGGLRIAGQGVPESSRSAQYLGWVSVGTWAERSSEQQVHTAP